MPDLKTLGISPKAVLAFLYPFVATLVGVATTWVVQGTFDADAVRVGVAGLLASALAALGAYAGKPGNVKPVAKTDPDPPTA